MSRPFRVLIYAHDACILSGCLACLTAGLLGFAAMAMKFGG
jgi:hypothetical protein